MSTVRVINGTPWTFPDDLSDYKQVDNWPKVLDDVFADIANVLQMSATDSLSIGSGTKVFNPAIMRAVKVGMHVQAIYDANNWMFGKITTLTASAITLTISTWEGSGTYAAWDLQPMPPLGLTGNNGAGHYNWQGVIAGNHTFAADDFATLDCALAQRNGTLPLNPAVGVKVKVGKVGKAYPIAVVRNGQKINEVDADETIPANEIGTWEFTFVGGDTGWLWEH